MVSTVVLVVSFVVLRAVGLLGVAALDNWNTPLRFALAAMFLVTASAHWGRGRADLVRMVPPVFPAPELMVTATGVLEILGGVGLLIPHTARWAAIGLALLLVAIFPANIRAARERLSILGRPATALAIRGPMQLLYIAAVLAAGMWGPQAS